METEANTQERKERGFPSEYTVRVSSRLLCGRPLHLQLSKHDFTVVLLRSLGPVRVSSTIVNDIFEQIDEDKNGFINADELSTFLQAKEHGRFSHFMRKRIVNAPNIGGVMFVCGSTLSILNNLWKRSRELTGVMAYASYIIMWLFFIASALFAGDFIRTTMKRLQDEGVKSLTRQLLRKSTNSLEQIINLMWLLGSLAYVLAIHNKGLALSDAATSHLWLIGGLSYFLGGLLTLPSIYRKALAKINQKKEMLRNIRDIIESKQRLRYEEMGFDSIDCPAATCDLERAASESMQPKHLQPSHDLQNTSPVILRIVVDDDTLLQGKLTQQCSTESFNTLDTESLTFSQDTLSTRRRSEDFSVERSGPAFDDVYTSLHLSSGKPVNVDVFVQVLNEMYANGQIDMSLHEQFAKKTRLWQETVMTTGFCIAILYTVAGIFFTIGAIDTGLPGDVVQNMFLSGSCIYVCAGVFCLYQQWKFARSSWHTLQSVVLALQQYTFLETTQSD